MNILMIGYGKMGGAMAARWCASGVVENIDAVSPHAKDKPALARLTPFASIEEWAALKRPVDMVVLAIKPQMFAHECPRIKSCLPDDTPVLSVAAGITRDTMRNLLGDSRIYIRTMPNTPSAIGKGVIGYVLSENIKKNQLDAAVSLLNTLGTSIQLPDETMIDALSAISGSGPAYFYFFTEALEKAAINSNLPADIAKILARDTLIGAAALLEVTGDSPEHLRANVTSPNGSTAAAIKALEENRGLESLLNQAVSAAIDRARALGKIQ